MTLPADFVEALERDASLCRPERWRDRIEALDRLELLLMTGADATAGDGIAIGEATRRRVAALQSRLQAANLSLWNTIRGDIVRGDGAGRLPAFASDDDARASGADDGDRYDSLDDLVSGVLRLDEPGSTTVAPDPDSVFYQPTPARHAFDLIRRAALTESDVFVDFGCGLGHVALLVASCTAAEVVGIDIEHAYVRCAQQAAQALQLPRTSFLHQYARHADFSTGTLFYLYTPFGGSILRAVLASLRCEAKRRPIRIGAFGPCVPAIATESWLTADGALERGRLALFRSIDPPPTK